jgi:hypothetical protein
VRLQTFNKAYGFGDFLLPKEQGYASTKGMGVVPLRKHGKRGL